MRHFLLEWGIAAAIVALMVVVVVVLDGLRWRLP